MAKGSCKDYQIEDQCNIDASNKKCGWNGTTCADKSCATAPATADYATHANCQTYLSTCTVANTTAGQGCVALADCSTYAQSQCYISATGDSCYWDATAGNCIKRTCENAPTTALDSAGCNDYLTGCTTDSVKCKLKICEDFAFTTDALCAAALPNSSCTTNGSNCVSRGTCAQAATSDGCTTSIDSKKCQWVEAVGTVSAYCTIMTCQTAPKTNDTETKCKAYYPEGGCTTTSGGGCVVKGTCLVATHATACVQDVNKVNCYWDSTGNTCRYKVCSDYAGSTHSACQGVDVNLKCTAGKNGQCANWGSCSSAQAAAGCIVDSSGNPCLWIADVTNADGSKGACYQYDSCKSLSWVTNSNCNLISTNCTTNGINCIGITLCSETNVAGGCVNGYDGACIQSVDALGSSNPAQCKAYTSCQVAYYATHVQCQNASTKCTTNGSSGCIDLAACSTYAQAGCYINNVGVVTSSGAITSTGICTWDTTTNVCRDQNCSDLKGIDNISCNSQLSTCTSDGTNCIAKAACSTYAQAGCTKLVGVGSDGYCFWDTTLATPACRVMACSDVTSGTSTTVCQAGLTGCVSDGTKCITKAKCETYTTKTGCNSGGTDGICVFTQSTATGATAGTGTCKLMTTCADASNDQAACTVAKDRCSWTAATTGTTATASKCATHTCTTNQATNGVCKNFLNWAQTYQQLCTIVSGKCTETDGANLTSSTCYASYTAYAYTWNTAKSTCGVCTAATPQPNTTNNTNTTNTTNDTTTTSGYMLGFTSIMLGYLMF